MRLFSIILICFVASPAFSQDEFLVLDDGARLYVEEAGEGETMVFIPGWTMTHRFFEKQVNDLSGQFHLVTYDPRGQGRSDKTKDRNTYADHASDLREMVLKKALNDVILVAWSSGCLAVYEYVRAYGYDRISKVVLIDEPPKWIGDIDTEWVYGNFDDYRSSLKSLISQPSDPDGIINWMLEEPVDSLTLEWMRKEILMTPRQVALNLYIDGLISDYTAEVTTLGSAIPTLYLVRSSWFDRANSWLAVNSPDSHVESISSHAMFWERPDEFNALLKEFIGTK